MTKPRAKKSFVVCLSKDGYAASLEPRKIYVALRDDAAERNRLCASSTNRARTISTRVSASLRSSCRAGCSRRWQQPAEPWPFRGQALPKK